MSPFEHLNHNPLDACQTVTRIRNAVEYLAGVHSHSAPHWQQLHVNSLALRHQAYNRTLNVEYGMRRVSGGPDASYCSRSRLINTGR